jgi:hypothetical protein
MAQMKLSILGKVSRQLNRSHSLDSHYWKKQAVLGICPSAVREWPTDQPRTRDKKAHFVQVKEASMRPGVNDIVLKISVESVVRVLASEPRHPPTGWPPCPLPFVHPILEHRDRAKESGRDFVLIGKIHCGAPRRKEYGNLVQDSDAVLTRVSARS